MVNPIYNNSVNNLFRDQAVTSTAATAYTALATDVFIDVFATAATAISLPNPAAAGAPNIGKFYVVKDANGTSGSFAITVTPLVGTIDGGASKVINSPYGSLYIWSDGTNYFAIDNASTSFSWVAAPAAVTMVANNGYYVTGVGPITMTLPTASPVGQVIELTSVAANTGGWKIAQAAGQLIQFGNQTTTTGTTGSLTSSSGNGGDSVRLLCTTSPTTFEVISSIGNILVT